MIIDCKENPDDLISKIGDRFFSLLDEDVDPSLRHPNHPSSLRIIDCEDGVQIDVYSEHGELHTRESAQALLALLNQEYTLVSHDH